MFASAYRHIRNSTKVHKKSNYGYLLVCISDEGLWKIHTGKGEDRYRKGGKSDGIFSVYYV